MATVQSPILVTTPTGNIGRRVTQRLLDAGEPTRLFVRDRNRLSIIAATHAEVVEGDLQRTDDLRTALDGVRAVFFLAPPNLSAESFGAWYTHLGNAFVDALPAGEAPRIVFLSSAGAQRDDLGPISALGAVENMLYKKARHVVALRPGYFMENFLVNLATIASEQTMYNALPPDLPNPMVATRDIADVAVRWLRSGDWAGHDCVGVHGPSDCTMREAAVVFSDALDRPVHYQQVSPEAVAETLLSMGASPGIAADYASMTGGLAHYGTAYKAEPRTKSTTTPTTLKTFARDVLRPAFEAQGLHA